MTHTKLGCMQVCRIEMIQAEETGKNAKQYIFGRTYLILDFSVQSIYRLKGTKSHHFDTMTFSISCRKNFKSF